MASEIGRLPQELEEVLTLEDLAEWGVFFRMRAEAERAAVEKATAEAKAKAKVRK